MQAGFVIWSCLASAALALNMLELTPVGDVIVETLPTGQLVQKPQYNQLLFTGSIGVGTPPQWIPFAIDTGSPDLWALGANYHRCPETSKFDLGTSSSYSSFHRRGGLCYVAGCVEGDLGRDTIALGLLSVRGTIMVVNDTQLRCHIAGILGLSSRKQSKNIIDRAYQEGLLVSQMFALQLSTREAGQKSYLFYNITARDFPQANFMTIVNDSNWGLNCSGLEIDGKKHNVPEFFVDSGSQYTYISGEVHSQIDSQFDPYCTGKRISNRYRVCSCDLAQYPNVTLHFQQPMVLTPPMYITPNELTGECMLDIVAGQMTLLGVNVLKHYIVVFDKANAKIGFARKGDVVNQTAASGGKKSKVWVLWVVVISICVLFGVGLCILKRRYLRARRAESETVYLGGKNSDIEITGD